MGDFLRDRLPDPAEFFASEGVALSGKGIWRTAPCNFHGSQDSLRINTSSGAFVCMAACGLRGGDVLAYRMAAHGEDFQTAAKALGAWQESTTPNRRFKPTPLPARDALAVLASEANLTAIAAANVARGHALTDADRARVMQAAGRIIRIAEAFA